MSVDALQWPAAALSLLGAWYAGGATPRLRLLGFALFLCTNITWSIWGAYVGAWAIVAMQSAFVVTSVRGIITNAHGLAAPAATQPKNPTKGHNDTH